MRANCPKAKHRESEDEDPVLAIPDVLGGDEEPWILDSGSSRHFVGDETCLDVSKDAEGMCVYPDSKPLKISKKGAVTLAVTAIRE